MLISQRKSISFSTPHKSNLQSFQKASTPVALTAVPRLLGCKKHSAQEMARNSGSKILQEDTI